MNGLIGGGDFQIYYPDLLKDFVRMPSAWNWTLKSGLGAYGAPLLWNYVLVQIPVLFFGPFVNFNWEILQRIGYLYPLLVFTFISPYFFFKKIFKFPFLLVALVIFSLNTYNLMLIGGGQIFLSLAYVLMPAVFCSFYNLMDEEVTSDRKKTKRTLIASILVAFQLLIDIRIAYVTLFLVGLFTIFKLFFLNTKLKNVLFVGAALILSGLINAFWILPTIFVRQNPISVLGAEFTSDKIVGFLSFARFENTISLLHPNWPENIFGKVYFMRPEFLVLPVMAFSSLLFLKKEKKEFKVMILFFGMVSLIGSFLAKGANEPFGAIYLWLFNYFPGFIMFRDSTKWYPLIAFSYAVLIPYSIFKIYDYVNGKNIKLLSSRASSALARLTLLLSFLYLLYLLLPAISGQLGGLFRATSIPYEYLELKKFITSDNHFYRTLYVPKSSRLSFYSSLNPISFGSSFFQESDPIKIIKLLKKENSEKVLQEASIKYVVVPYDKEKEIFLNDRKYDEKKYLQVVKELKEVQYLKEIKTFGKIIMFEVPDPKDHFWSTSSIISSYERIYPSRYKVNIVNAKKGDLLVFAENFDKNWEAIVSGITIGSLTYNNRNSFSLPEGTYSATIYYKPQDWVNIGLFVSIASLFFVITGIMVLRKR